MKPELFYRRAFFGPLVGHSAILTADRPDGRTDQPVYTSVVVAVNDDGSFETLNTLYVPKPEEG